ncbi:MAG: hypothetical protein JWQ86_1719, partial [Mycobacterium sp.]|nr:hypothetical protein [Mycobacterium sp.]
RPAPLGTFRIPLHQTDAITADTTSGPPAARTSSACRRAFEGQPLDGNPLLGNWRSATKSYPSGQRRDSVVIWVVRYVAVERISERVWSCFRPASVRRPRWGVRAAPAAAWRGPSRDTVRVKLERLSLTPQSQRPAKTERPEDKSARSNRHVRLGAGEDFRLPSHVLNCGGLVGSQPKELCHGVSTSVTANHHAGVPVLLKIFGG